MASDLLPPRVQPAELVQRFATRGITLQAAADGKLKVVPGDLLTAADVALLKEHKAAILDVLARPAVMV